MTHWVNERRPLTTPQYDAQSAAVQAKADAMNVEADRLHVDGTGEYDDIEKVPFHKRVFHAQKVCEFSQQYVAEN